MIFGRKAFVGHITDPVDRSVRWFINLPRRHEPTPEELAALGGAQPGGAAAVPVRFLFAVDRRRLAVPARPQPAGPHPGEPCRDSPGASPAPPL
jgi:hypothetical protein